MRGGRIAGAAMLAILLAIWPASSFARADRTGAGQGESSKDGKAQPAAKPAGKRQAARKRKQARRKRQQAARQRRATRRRKQARRKRQAAAKKRANRPRGWQWPPTAAMEAQGRECLDSLTTLGVHWKRAGRRKGIVTPIVVPSLAFKEVDLAPTFRKPPFVMDCHLAVALAKAGSAIEKAGVAELRFSSIYSYRRAIVNGKQKQSLSRHSYGLAVDVYEVRDDLGEVFKVEDHYADTALLQQLETVINETGLFRLVLSPANDPQSHSDHLHLEARTPPLNAKPANKRRRKAPRKRRRRKSKRKPSQRR